MQTVKITKFNDETLEVEELTFEDVASFQFGGQYMQLIFTDGCSKVFRDVIEADIVPDGVKEE